MPRIFLGKAADVPAGRSKTFIASGKKVLVCNVGGEIKAYENFCPHMGGALRGDGERVTCAWHGACFSAKTGESVSGITEGSALTPFTVVEEAGSLYLEADSIPKSPWADDF